MQQSIFLFQFFLCSYAIEAKTCDYSKKFVRIKNNSKVTVVWLKVYNGVLIKRSIKKQELGNIPLMPGKELVLCTNFSDVKWKPVVKHGAVDSKFNSLLKQFLKEQKTNKEIRNETIYKIRKFS